MGLLKLLFILLTGIVFVILPLAGIGQATQPVQTGVLVPKKDTSVQTDLIDILKATFRIRMQSVRRIKGKKVYFSLLPITSNVPGGGKALITSTTAGFYLGDAGTTFLSSATFSPYVTLNGRFGIPLRTSVWLPHNAYLVQGDTRFLLYPQYTWGLGGNPANVARVLVNYQYIRFYQSVLKQIKPFIFVGLGYDLDYHTNIKVIGDTINLKEFTKYNSGTNTGQNSFSSGLTFNYLYDSRSNSINPEGGAFANVILRTNTQLLGSNTNWSSLVIDTRKYISFSTTQHNVLALWGYYWTVLNKDVPYLDLPSIGWDSYQRSGRGFDQNRYRGDGLVDLEAEYRRDITRNGLFGFVVFTNMNSVTEQNDYKFQYWHPAIGCGVRVKFNKLSGTNISLDYATSKGYSSLYINLGEVF